MDFFHASQCQQIVVGRSTYDEMRRIGCPRDRGVLGALEDYHRQAAQIAFPMNEPPAYRALVRGLIPLTVHGSYWTTCSDLTNGEEIYLEDCPDGVDPSVSAAGVAATGTHPDIHAALTEWAGFTGALGRRGGSVDGLIGAAERAVALIEAATAGGAPGADRSRSPGDPEVDDEGRAGGPPPYSLGSPVFPRPVARGIRKRVKRQNTQECCPYTRKLSRASSDPSFAARAPGEPPFGVQLEPGASTSHPGTASPLLIALLETALDEAAWDSFSRGSALRRAGRVGFARNVCVGLWNWGSPEAVPALTRALSDEEPLVRAHAAWPLGRVGTAEARSALSSRASVETDATVLEELSAAMDA